MQESEWARVLEPALQAQIATRCHRAYRHDLKNGLQGLYGGFDALNRLLQLSIKDGAKVQRTNELVRLALSAHEKTLERVLHSLAPLEQDAAGLDATGLLQELVKFLINDAATQRVTLRAPDAAAVTVAVHARSQKLRLILLSLMVDAIDAMPGGGVLQVTAATGNPLSIIELTDTRPGATLEHPWAIDLTAEPAYRGWVLFIVRHLIHGEAGSIECEQIPGGGRKVRISLPAAP